MNIRLVAGIENNRIFGRIKNAMDRYGGLNYSKIGAEVATGFGDTID
jgi:hypothetical protein